jgi:hypothetical protein
MPAMPKIAYTKTNFQEKTLDLIKTCNVILNEFERQGYDVTLRQLYYQLVSRDVIPNNQKEYNRLGSIVNDARLAGLIDWHHIIDRTRSLRSLASWSDPAEILDSVQRQYKIDLWKYQPHRIEVWIEKDALAGVFERVCNELRVPFFSCRGYTSQSEMWSAAQRLLKYRKNGQEPVILHFGDHDPSGIDMSRDIKDRLSMFCGKPIQLIRLALNMDQVERFNPPPNPAKITDSRAVGYIKRFGRVSWELDALSPQVLGDTVRANVLAHRDEDLWSQWKAAEDDQKEVLSLISGQFYEVAEFVGKPVAQHADLCKGCMECDPDNDTGWKPEHECITCNEERPCDCGSVLEEHCTGCSDCQYAEASDADDDEDYEDPE